MSWGYIIFDRSLARNICIPYLCICEFVNFKKTDSYTKNNFVSTIFNELQSSNEISIVSDQYGTPTFAGDLAKSTLSILLDKNIFQKLGLYHFGGTPSCSWYEFASEINKQMLELNIITQSNQIKKINSSQYNDSIMRPKNSGLNSFKICSTFNLKQCNWANSLSKVLMILN